jgi:hypothetical protein
MVHQILRLHLTHAERRAHVHGYHDGTVRAASAESAFGVAAEAAKVSTAYHVEWSLVVAAGGEFPLAADKQGT